MGYYVLHDTEADRAVLFDSVEEQPLIGATFMGAEAREQAETFIGWLVANSARSDQRDLRPPVALGRGRISYPDPSDPRCYTRAGLERMQEAWARECLEDNEKLNEYGWKVWQWWSGSMRADPPEPPAEAPSNVEPIGSRRADQ